MMAGFKARMLWDNIEKGDLSAVHELLQSGSINLEERDENGQTFLMLASDKGELHIFRELLDANVDVNAVDNENWSALMCAAKEGHLEIVIVLLEKSSDIEHRDLCGWTPLMWACYKGNSMVVQELLDRDANPNAKAEHNMTCLAWAAGRGYLEIVEMLLRKGAKVNASDKYGTTPLIWAARKGHVQIVDLLLENGATVDASGMNSWTPLLVATRGGYVDVVHSLLEHDLNINATDKDGLTALAVATKEGFLEIVHDLVAKGAYVNVTDRAGDTNLIHAVKGGHAEVVRVLLNKYVDVDVEGSEGRTALYWSVEKGYNNITRQLLDSDPNLELSTKDGDTPLLRAVRNRNDECVRLLLDKGAKVSASDKRGDTALHIAIRARNKRITELLLRNPKNGRLLYRANKNGDTPYTMDNYHQRGVLTQIFGHRNLNSSDAENLLGYEIFSSALADIVSDPSLITPITVGLYAKWGSGKSFLLGKLTQEMKSFTMQNLQEPFSFTWVIFIFLLCINVVIGEVLGLTVRFEVGLGVGLGLFVIEYAFLGIISVCSQKYDLTLTIHLSQALGRKFQILTLLLQTLFCNQQKKREFAKLVESGSVFCVRFLFSECTRLTSVGGEKYLAATIATLCEAVENEYSVLVTRLFRVFKPPVEKYKKNRFKTICCIPYFVLFIIFMLILAVGIAMVVTYGIAHNTAVNAVLISFASIVGLTLISNMFLLIQAMSALIVSQKARVLKSAEQIAELKMDGFMQKLKEEVDLMSQMVNCMDIFTKKQTRLVIIVDGLDSCEQDKVLQVLDTVNALFAEDNSPFITILAVDPHIIIKGIEQNIKSSFRESNVNGYDYLRNVVHLPFYLQTQGIKIQPRRDSIAPSASMHDNSTESPGRSFRKYHHQDSTMSNTSLDKHDKYSRKRSKIGSFSATSSFDLSNTVVKSDYFSDINPRSMKRLMNIVAVTARLLRAYNIDFNWHRLMAWINIIEQWPYRVSWIIYYFEETDNTDTTISLYSLYQKVLSRIPASKDVNPLVEIDRDARKLDAFLASKSGRTPLLNVGDLKKFLPVTINLDPFLRKLIREMENAVEVQREQQVMYPLNLNPLTPGLNISQQGSSDGLTNTRNLSQASMNTRFPMIHPFQNHMMPYGPMGMFPPYMPPYPNQMQGTPESQRNKVSPHAARLPYQFIHGYKNDIHLSSLTVQEVCDLLLKVAGIDQKSVSKYAKTITANNISGLVLANCDLDELGKVLAMKFGDWQLVKATIASLKEIDELTELPRVRDSVDANTNETDSNPLNNHVSTKGKEPVMRLDSTDSVGKKARFKRTDSVVQQLSFETAMLSEALGGLTEELSDDDDDDDEEVDESNVKFLLGSDSEREVIISSVDFDNTSGRFLMSREGRSHESIAPRSDSGKPYLRVIEHQMISRDSDTFEIDPMQIARSSTDLDDAYKMAENKKKTGEAAKRPVFVMENETDKTSHGRTTSAGSTSAERKSEENSSSPKVKVKGSSSASKDEDKESFV